jgi:hypothetical protein
LNFVRDYGVKNTVFQSQVIHRKVLPVPSFSTEPASEGSSGLLNPIPYSIARKIETREFVKREF